MKNISLKSLFKLSISLTLLILLSSCSYPNSKLTNISINGLLIDNNGQPITNKTVEVILPASYGLKEIDKELNYGSNRRDSSAKIRTDATGNFNYTFNKVHYNTAFWFLPPLGNFPKEPPAPSFLIKFFDTENTIYSLGWSDDKLNYAVQRTKKRANPPYFLKGQLIRSTRGEIDTCVANLHLRKSK